MNPSDNQKQAVGLRIKEARSALGLTQKELCEQAKMKLPSVRDYELGNSIPGGEAVAALMRVGINANWLLTGEGEMLLADYHARLEAERKESFGDVPERIGNTLPPHMMEVLKREMAKPENQPSPMLHMYGVSTHEGKPRADQAIDEILLSSCHAACKAVYGNKFEAESAVVQMGYAADLYGLLVRLCASNEKDLGEMKRLEVNGLIELLKIYVKLGWSRQFPPHDYKDGCFF